MAEREVLVHNQTAKRSEAPQSGDQPTLPVPIHVAEQTGTPTPIASKYTVYCKDDDLLYYQDGAGVEHLIGGIPTYKSYTFVARDASSGENFSAGFYDYSATDANLTQASLTQVHGTANTTYAAHAFVVAAAAGVTDGSDLVLTVSGTSITDAGTRTPADSEVIVADCAAVSTDEYFETTKKWLGQITYTLSSTGGTAFNFDFNYGLSKYEDFGNRDFTLTDFEGVGLGNVNDTGFNIQLLHHKASGWTYAATGFVAGCTPVADLNVIHSTEQNVTSGDGFAFKRAGLSTAVSGSALEGLIVRVTTGINNSVSYLDLHIGVTF
jgi:hypothetical protein